MYTPETRDMILDYRGHVSFIQNFVYLGSNIDFLLDNTKDSKIG